MPRSNAGVLPTCTPDHSKDQVAAKLLHILEEDRRPFKTLELAKSVSLETKHQVNSILSDLQSQGKICKVQEQPPMWELASDNTAAASEDVDMPRSNAGVLPTCTPDRSKHQVAAKLLHILEGDRRPFKTLELAKLVGLETKHQVNSILSDLQSQGKICKVQEQPPMWELASDNTAAASEDVDMPRSNAGVLPTCTPDRSKDQVAAKLLHILEGDRRPFKTLELAKLVGLETKHQVNSILSDLQSQGKICKVQEQPPMWELASGNTAAASEDVPGNSKSG